MQFKAVRKNSVDLLSVVVLEESPCLRGSSRTNIQVLFLVLGFKAIDGDMV